MSKGPWKRDASGRPLAQALPEEALAIDATPAIEGCPNPLTVTNSIAHAASGQPEGCSPNAFNPSREISRMEAAGYPFVRINGILITDQSSAAAFGEDRRKRSNKKIKTDPSSGSAC